MVTGLTLMDSRQAATRRMEVAAEVWFWVGPNATGTARFGREPRLMLARTHLMNGKPEPALDLLEKLLDSGYFLTPAWLRIDPAFAVLKGNPRFEALGR
jgi:hypothetical protein